MSLPIRSFDLSKFDLSDMIECGRAVRDVSVGADSMEGVAQAVISLFHRSFVDGETGEPSCVLARCFKTHRFGQLPDEIVELARKSAADGVQYAAEMPVLTLLATAGEQKEWNDRRSSQGHAAIPLTSVEMVERAPMIAALLRQMGLRIEAALYPTRELILDADEHAFNVFHVEQALGDARIPAQDGFVRLFGVQSVLGFGGLLPSGDLFAVILFSRVRIPRATADLFRPIALAMKLALLPFTRGPIFVGAPGQRVGSRVTEWDEEELRSELATMRLLNPALEEAAIQQTERLKAAVCDLREQEEARRGEEEKQRKLFQDRQQFFELVESSSDLIGIADMKGFPLYANRAAFDLLGIEGLASFEGKDTRRLFFPDDQAYMMQEFLPKVRREGSAKAEIRLRHFVTGAAVWVDYRVFLLRGANGEETGFATVSHDLTEQKKTADALMRTEKLAAVGRLAASIAHEINNPLEAVTNLLYLAQTTSEPEELRGYLQTAERELRRVSVIANQTLRFHKQATKPQPVSCRDLTESVLTMHQGRMVNASVTLEHRDRCAEQVTCFDGEIRQVLSNLVGNAIDAMAPRGGKLRVRSRSGCHWKTGRKGALMTVADTGSGIAAEALERIFDPFFTTKGMSGTGLGLWVSHEIILRHEGTLRVRSRVGSGTVFTLFLPLDAVRRA